MRSISTRTRLRLAWALAPFFFLLAEPSGRSLSLGILPAVAGMALRAWAASHIRKDRVLATTGPYAYLRHPLWTGSFLLLLGLALASGRWYFVGGLPLLFLAVYVPAAQEEERRLALLFGEAYRSYRARTPAVWPRWGRRGVGERKEGPAVASPMPPASSPSRPPGAGEGDSYIPYPQHLDPTRDSDPLSHGVALGWDSSSARWRLYLRNGEWQTPVGVAAAFLLLWLRVRGF